MIAKTIFLTNLDEVIVYDGMFHTDNHDHYIKRYYSNLKVTEYIPILLTKYNHCVIDLSNSYLLGAIYLPIWMSEFQKDYFTANRDMLKKYTLYLNGYSLEQSILIEELLNIIELLPINPKEKKL